MLGLLVGLVLATSVPQDVVARSSATAQDPNETRVDDVIVQGRSVRQQAEAYITELTAAPGRRRLARWRRTVCVGVTGLDAAYAQFVVDRVSAVAASVGLDPGDPGCRPDVLIAVTRDPDAVAQAWVARDIDAFRPLRTGPTDLGAEALDRFKFTDDPVRWWHVSLTVNAQSGMPVTRFHNDLSPPANYLNTPSLIQASTREALFRTIIIVDANQIGPVSFGGLSDYIALLALAQVDPEAETAEFDTVLNLFSSQPVARLSDWDIGFLQTLYAISVNPSRASRQGRQIAGALADRRLQNAAPSSNLE